MRVDFKHVQAIHKRLADGSTRTYFYHRRTRKRIDAEPGTPEWIDAYREAARFDGAVAPGSLNALICDYKSSEPFKALRARTRADYAKHLEAIADEFGAAPLAAFADRRVRADIRKWRDARAAGSARQADYAVSVLGAVLRFAIEDGKLSVNHASGIGRLYKSDRAHKIWQAADLAAFEAEAPPHLRLALHLARDTGQRESDLLALTWAQYDGTHIRLRQGKSRQFVGVKCTGTLRTLLDAERARVAGLPGNQRAVTILTGARGRPWTQNGFLTEWRKVAKRAGIAGRLTFNDLRGTFITEQYEAGSSSGVIATITGHSVRHVESIIESYLARIERLGDQAIANLERHRRAR